ncbi:putative F-box domain, leucine-rich repeat domain superfamily, F-box-like domain superfamily [Helianthus anomalus]
MMPSPKKLIQQERNWLDLPSDVTANILERVGMVDILENAQKVCTAWRKICKDPAMWRVINMSDIDILRSDAIFSSLTMCKHAVDRSQGQLVDITLVFVYDPGLLSYIADRSSQLRRLEMAFCFLSKSWTTDALMKFPLLEELNLYDIEISKEEIETVGRYCPMLKTLKVNRNVWRFRAFNFDEGSLASYKR